jgi:thiol-disulfide isomerase/thioredoxin
VLAVIFVVLAAAWFWGAPPVAAVDETPVVIYFFWGDGCPHCAAQKPFLADLQARYPAVEVRAYEVWYNAANQQHFWNMARAYGFEPQAVPTTWIGSRYWLGFGDSTAAEMEAAVQSCLRDGCVDAGQGIIPGLPKPRPTATPAPVAAAPAPALPAAAPAPDLPPAAAITVPFLGSIDLASQSLLASTAIIAFVDGFNPCSLWVLSILLALTLHTGSRKKVLVIGLVFISVTALIYMLFIAGLFTLFTFVGFLGWIQVLVALVALFFGLVNIKDYFWYQAGLSFTIADSRKPGIYQGMRRVLAAGDSWVGLIGATVVLAVGVSVIEFSCTAGFPVLWTNLLTAQEVSASAFVGLLLVYMLIYQLDELAIFLGAVITLKSNRLEETQGRLLKLIGGTVMLTLAVVMLVNPAWMNSLGASLAVFGVALLLAGLVVLLHRLLLPKFGIHLGNHAPVTPKASQPHAKKSPARRHS